jgi:hypothetical protein
MGSKRGLLFSDYSLHLLIECHEMYLFYDFEADVDVLFKK